MSDLIDRCNLRLMRTEECAGHTIEYALGWKACIEWMKTLPSAQPDVIRCKDCKYLDTDSVFHEPWCRGNRVFVSDDHYCGYAVRRSDERLN